MAFITLSEEYRGEKVTCNLTYKSTHSDVATVYNTS